MKTINLFKTTFLFIFLTLAIPFTSDAFVEKTDPATEAANRAVVQKLENRLNEIKAMDHKSLSKSERKALRKEVREIKREVKAISGGIYISVGALILIILLLILLL